VADNFSPCTKYLAIEYGFREIEFLPWKGSHQVWLQGDIFIPYKVQCDTYVCTWNVSYWRNIMPPELNVLPKLELLNTLLSFSHAWAPTSISVKQQFASATTKKFIG
jgi:hypothetical protein